MPIDYELISYGRRLHKAVWRHYVMEAAACIGGAILVASAFRCVLHGHYGSATSCAIGAILAFVVFDYARKAGARARSTLKNIDHS